MSGDEAESGMRVTVLGSGTSGGVPTIFGGFGKCDPHEPRNVRSRVSVHLQIGRVGQEPLNWLFDTSPDLRQQCLREGIDAVDAVFYTHDHADHVHGIDDLKGFCLRTQAALPVYGTAETLASIRQRFAYAFPQLPPSHYFRPVLVARALDLGQWEPIQDVPILPFPQMHGRGVSTGYRVGNFAYSTDTNFLPDEAFALLEGVEHWIIDCLGTKPHPTHSHLAQTLEWIERLGVKQAYLTHMSNELDYGELCATLPAHIRPAYDGLSFTL